MDKTVIQLASFEYSFDLLERYNQKIGCSLSKLELERWIQKILSVGDPLAMLDNNEIVAFLLLYCNNIETQEAYICNVYVSENYRGRKLSEDLVKNAILICKSRRFNSVILDVEENNDPALCIYKKCGFEVFDTIQKEGHNYLKMKYML